MSMECKCVMIVREVNKSMSFGRIAESIIWIIIILTMDYYLLFMRFEIFIIMGVHLGRIFFSLQSNLMLL